MVISLEPDMLKRLTKEPDVIFMVKLKYYFKNNRFINRVSAKPN